MSLFLWEGLRRDEQRGEVTIPRFKQTGEFVNKVVLLSGTVQLVKSGGGLRMSRSRFFSLGHFKMYCLHYIIHQSERNLLFQLEGFGYKGSESKMLESRTGWAVVIVRVTPSCYSSTYYNHIFLF